MNINEARRLQQAEQALEAAKQRIARLERAIEAMQPTGPGRKPAWVTEWKKADDG